MHKDMDYKRHVLSELFEVENPELEETLEEELQYIDSDTVIDTTKLSSVVNDIHMIDNKVCYGWYEYKLLKEFGYKKISHVVKVGSNKSVESMLYQATGKYEDITFRDIKVDKPEDSKSKMSLIYMLYYHYFINEFSTFTKEEKYSLAALARKFEYSRTTSFFSSTIIKAGYTTDVLEGNISYTEAFNRSNHINRFK